MARAAAVEVVDPHGLLNLGDQLVAYQSHHHSLFLDQTISDALGGEGMAVRRQAAFESSHALLATFFTERQVRDPAARLELACRIFATMGHGRLAFEITAEGGVVRGSELHYGESFSEKYGGVIRNRRPVDTFAAGFISAAASLAFPSDWGTLEAEETTCVAQSDDAGGTRPTRPPRGTQPAKPTHGAECTFVLTRRPERPRFGTIVTRALVERLPLAPPQDGMRPRVDAARAAADLGRLLDATTADEDGAIVAFGVRIALVPVSYINQITYDTVHLIEKRSPELFPLVATLAREAAQIGAFHLLGGVIASPAWQAENGVPSNDVRVRLQQLVGLTAAFGWGAIYAHDFVPGKSLLLRGRATHETAYYAIRHGATVRSRLFFQQGLALAIMQLLHRIDFAASLPIARETYDSLFRSGPRYTVEEKQSVLRGDRACEVLVEIVGG